jgi:hypothetical protein
VFIFDLDVLRTLKEKEMMTMIIRVNLKKIFR